jgi:seryl-tRNA synthetase
VVVSFPSVWLLRLVDGLLAMMEESQEMFEAKREQKKLLKAKQEAQLKEKEQKLKEIELQVEEQERKLNEIQLQLKATNNSEERKELDEDEILIREKLDSLRKFYLMTFVNV